MRLFFLFIWASLFIVACDTTSYHYQHKETIPVAGWKYDDVKAFTFDIQDTSKMYTILLDVHHTTNYPYQNLYYFTTTHFPSGKELEQVITTNLADKAGIWNGDCSGENCTSHIDLQKKARFNEIGKHTIFIAQHSRDEELTGIKGLTLKLKVLE